MDYSVIDLDERTKQNIIDCVIRIGELERAYIEEKKGNMNLCFTYIPKKHDFDIPQMIRDKMKELRVNLELRKALGFDD